MFVDVWFDDDTWECSVVIVERRDKRVFSFASEEITGSSNCRYLDPLELTVIVTMLTKYHNLQVLSTTLNAANHPSSVFSRLYFQNDHEKSKSLFPSLALG